MTLYPIDLLDMADQAHAIKYDMPIKGYDCYSAYGLLELPHGECIANDLLNFNLNRGSENAY